MYKDKKIGVTVPCYNEDTQISIVIETMPDFVDKIIIVDDKSKDKTVEVAKGYQAKPEYKDKIVIIEHQKNKGVGGAISTGYVWCRENDMDAVAVMAGDAQMDPDDLPSLLDPVIEGKTDYSKGNRLITGEAFKKIPKVRYFGNTSLTLMTKIASGYWHVTDSQTGYTVLSKKALNLLPIEGIFPNYGMPNDFLVTLNIYDMRVMDIPINPLYGVGERSKMVIHRAIPSLLWLMIRLFLRRMLRKYIIRDFHPLIFFYILGFILGAIAIPLIVNVLTIYFILDKSISPINGLATGMMVVMSLQFLLFGMWMDMDYNRNLNPHR